jgi:predicted nucleic acid-binding protein
VGGTLSRLLDALADVTRLGLDTAPLIYLVEAHPIYGAMMLDVMKSVEQSSLFCVTSTLTLLELLTKPIQQGDLALQREYSDLLVEAEGLELVDVTPVIAKEAARLRAQHRLKTPDALQIASAIVSDCQAFLTNDHIFRRVNEITVLILDDFVPPLGVSLP